MNVYLRIAKAGNSIYIKWALKFCAILPDFSEVDSPNVIQSQQQKMTLMRVLKEKLSHILEKNDVFSLPQHQIVERFQKYK